MCEDSHWHPRIADSWVKRWKHSVQHWNAMNVLRSVDAKTVTSSTMIHVCWNISSAVCELQCYVTHVNALTRKHLLMDLGVFVFMEHLLTNCIPCSTAVLSRTLHSQSSASKYWSGNEPQTQRTVKLFIMFYYLFACFFCFKHHLWLCVVLLVHIFLIQLFQCWKGTAITSIIIE